MKKLNWIESAGGPLIILGADSLNSWSGIFKKSLYLEGIVEEAEDFLDPQEADYGKACLVDDYLGLIEVGTETGLVLGAEPLSTAILYATPNEVGLVRWYYGEGESNELLQQLDCKTLDNWVLSLTTNFNSNEQFLFDSAWDGKGLIDQREQVDFLKLQLPSGKYQVYTVVYEPDEKNLFYLHKLVNIS